MKQMLSDAFSFGLVAYAYNSHRRHPRTVHFRAENMGSLSAFAAKFGLSLEQIKSDVEGIGVYCAVSIGQNYGSKLSDAFRLGFLLPSCGPNVDSVVQAEVIRICLAFRVPDALVERYFAAGDADKVKLIYEIQELMKSSTERVTILVLTSNPSTTSRLDLEEEMREIEDALSRVVHREAFKIKFGHATRPDDLVALVRQEKPKIIHFSGHGSKEGIILRADSDWIAVRGSSLAKFLNDRGVQLVVLNACFSMEQAKQISNSVPVVVGTTEAVGDEAAIKFSRAFYRSVGNGLNVGEAFRDAKDAIALYNLDDVYESIGSLSLTIV